MLISAWPWVIGAGTALVGSVVAFSRTRDRRKAQTQFFAKVEFVGLALALLAAAVGIGWRAWDARAWPGASPADALALLAGGGLVAAAWQAWDGRRDAPDTLQRTALGLPLLGTAALLGLAAGLAADWPAAPITLPARTWLFGFRNILAGIGLGSWLPALAASVRWYAQTLTGPSAPVPTESASGAVGADEPPPARPETAKPAEDPGRAAALFGFPWLTAACLLSGAWNMVTQAAIGQAAPADLWLLAAWLLGGAYLNITSSWQPLRVPGWFSPLIATGAFAAGVLAASAAASLRVYP